MSRSRATAGLAALAVAAVAGCGSSPLSPTELRQQATTICSRADRQLGRIATPGSPSAGNAFLKQGIAALEPQLAGLKGLVPPQDEATVYQSAITALSGALDALKAAVSQLDQGADPVKTFRSLQDRLAPLETEADNAWHALNITACLSRS